MIYFIKRIELSIRYQPDKFPERSIEREAATKHQQRLNSVSEAMENLHSLGLNRKLNIDYCQLFSSVGIYTLNYNTCFHLSVMAKKKKKSSLRL
jgi:hypothetical protein